MNSDVRFTERIQVMVSPELLDRLQQKATERGLGMSALVRWVMLAFLDDDLGRANPLLREMRPYMMTTKDTP